MDKTVLEVRIDASAGRGMSVRRGAGRVRHIATPTLRVRKLAQESEKHEQSMEYRTLQILEPNTLRPEVQEITRPHPEVFAVDHACELDTQSETELEAEQY